jgi:hypothetical protein
MTQCLRVAGNWRERAGGQTADALHRRGFVTREVVHGCDGYRLTRTGLLVLTGLERKAGVA